MPGRQDEILMLLEAQQMAAAGHLQRPRRHQGRGTGAELDDDLRSCPQYAIGEQREQADIGLPAAEIGKCIFGQAEPRQQSPLGFGRAAAEAPE